MLEGTSPVLRRERSRKAPDLSDYNNPLLKALHELSAPIWVERAVQIKESLGMVRGKTDKVDAQRIGLYAYKTEKKPACGLPHGL